MDRKEGGRIKEGERMDGWVWVYRVNVFPFS